ncbi:hypothetical protein FZEAL_8052 [Fusarium zealandicum]|uniref:Major facilitator superfamily (MFS) profile domain-containing protein n=1 Tax=Fusarium zealandicum TaxID=1053134 RepID=A0A8H4XH89_9HYPO|nr:hypothetical protein FZEAL_8052 [Fusarium zealandicum]
MPTHGSSTDSEPLSDIQVRQKTPLRPANASSTIETQQQPWLGMEDPASTYTGFLIAGANDAVYGALLPYLRECYQLSYLELSLLFLAPFVGHIFSAALGDLLQRRIGQRGARIVHSVSRLAAFNLIAQHLAYPTIILASVLSGFANGADGAAWNTWVRNPSSFVQAAYGLGGALSSLAATLLMSTRHGFEWFTVYYIMVGLLQNRLIQQAQDLQAILALIHLILCTRAFFSDSKRSHYSPLLPDHDSQGDMWTALFTLPHARVSWLCISFLLVCVCIEVSLYGWLVVFALDIRHYEPFDAGMVAVGFRLGVTLGRALLGPVTSRMGVQLSLLVSILATIALGFLFWVVPVVQVAMVAITLQGLFLGPMVSDILVAGKILLPSQVFSSVIRLAATLGDFGAAVSPVMVGVLAQIKDIQALSPMILYLLSILFIIWLLLPWEVLIRPQNLVSWGEGI